MKHSKSMAYLRQLCCLGLGKDVVIPEFLRAVEDVIPSHNNLLTHLDEKGVPIDLIINIFLPDIFFIASGLLPMIHTPEQVRTINEIFRKDHFIPDTFYFSDKVFQSDFHHLVMIPSEQHYFVVVPVYVNQKVVEEFWLCRPCGDKPFSEKEQQLAAQLSPYLTHALHKRPDASTVYVDSGQSSLIIANANGEIIYLGKEAQRLLTLATQLELYKSGRPFTISLPPALVALCRNLDGIFQGKAMMPPLYDHTNAYGKFGFRAYWLDKLNREPGGLIGITIEHQELAVFRGLKDTALSSTQKQVALMLTQGLSNEQIGQRLHIKLATVKEHVRNIFVKLDINQRHELLPKLLAKGNGADTFKIFH